MVENDLGQRRGGGKGKREKGSAVRGCQKKKENQMGLF